MCVRASLAVSFIALFGISSCGSGVSGENGSDPFGTGDTTTEIAVDLNILNQQCRDTDTQSFIAGESLCVQATLTQDDVAFVGEIINFTSGLGELAVTSKLTDSQGQAQVFISSDTSNIGASTITATYGETSTAVNFEFLVADPLVTTQASISVSMQKNAVPINRFKADETVQLQATLLDMFGGAIGNQIVLFSTGKGILNISETLTNDMGIAQVALAAAGSDIGAMVVSVQSQVRDVLLVVSMNVEILSADAVTEQMTRLGHFTRDNIFIEGEIGVFSQDSTGDVNVSAGGRFGLSVGIADQNDQRILTPTPVSFSSNCVADGKASIDLLINTLNGVAQTTFKDINCAGSNGNNDIIVASLVVNNNTVSISRAISILPENIGTMEFISATPQNIVLQGTGGQNNQSVAMLVFQVTGESGAPLSQQEVNFSLNTETGGLALSQLAGITNSQGQVSTTVIAGSVPTSVRVTAKITTVTGVVVSTQSDLLSVNTGLPDQNSFTFYASNLNPEANSISGQTVNLVVRLADTFNNPVPDGTSVSFTAEGGVIAASCITTNGNCSVQWTSANPRVDDHRVTILATAIGHETLFDANGNNSYEDSDGSPITDSTDSGFGSSSYGVTGFVDHSEAWRDDNENNTKDAAEIFLDYDNNALFSQADAVFNGPQCLPGNACGEGNQSTLHIRKALVLVMSGSNALMDIINSNDTLMFSNHQTASQPNLSINSGSSLNFKLRFSDDAVQPIASGSQVVISSSAGTLTGQIALTMPSTNKPGASELSFTLSNNEQDPVGSTVSALITSPSGIQSTVFFQVSLN